MKKSTLTRPPLNEINANNFTGTKNKPIGGVETKKDSSNKANNSFVNKTKIESSNKTQINKNTVDLPDDETSTIINTINKIHMSLTLKQKLLDDTMQKTSSRAIEHMVKNKIPEVKIKNLKNLISVLVQDEFVQSIIPELGSDTQKVINQYTSKLNDSKLNDSNVNASKLNDSQLNNSKMNDSKQSLFNDTINISSIQNNKEANVSISTQSLTKKETWSIDEYAKELNKGLYKQSKIVEAINNNLKDLNLQEIHPFLVFMSSISKASKAFGQLLELTATNAKKPSKTTEEFIKEYISTLSEEVYLDLVTQFKQTQAYKPLIIDKLLESRSLANKSVLLQINKAPSTDEQKENKEITSIDNKENVLQGSGEGGEERDIDWINPYFGKYTVDALRSILSLRINDLELKGMTILEAKFLDKNHNSISDLIAQISSSTTQSTLVPINLFNKHAAGIVFTKTLKGEFEVTYLDSLNKPIPKELKQLITDNFNVKVDLKQIMVEQQKYANCGPEVIENFIYYLTAQRVTQEEAVVLHSKLLENKLLSHEDLEFNVREQIVTHEPYSDYDFCGLAGVTTNNE